MHIALSYLCITNLSSSCQPWSTKIMKSPIVAALCYRANVQYFDNLELVFGFITCYRHPRALLWTSYCGQASVDSIPLEPYTQTPRMMTMTQKSLCRNFFQKKGCFCLAFRWISRTGGAFLTSPMGFMLMPSFMDYSNGPLASCSSNIYTPSHWRWIIGCQF